MSRQIRVDDDQWKQLNRLKEPGDDFADVIDRLLGYEEELETLRQEVTRLESKVDRHIGDQV